MAVFNVAGYLIEERRRWPVITASPLTLASTSLFWSHLGYDSQISFWKYLVDWVVYYRARTEITIRFISVI